MTDQAALQQALRDRCLALKPGTSLRLSAGEVRETSGYALVRDNERGAAVADVVDDHDILADCDLRVLDGEDEIAGSQIPGLGAGHQSARGFLRVVIEDGDYALQDDADSYEGGELTPVWRDGEFLRTTNIGQIRERLKKGRP